MAEMDGSNRRRSQRVMLQLAIVVRVEVSEGRCYELKTFTTVVNAHGGLLEAPVRIDPKYPVTLFNPHTTQFAPCRIVRVSKTSDGNYAIAVEFSQPNPKFWNIEFPPADWGVHEEATHGN